MRFGFQHTRLLVEVVLEQVTDERLEFVARGALEFVQVGDLVRARRQLVHAAQDESCTLDLRREDVVGVFSTQDEVQGLQNRSWNEISPRTESKNEPFPAEPNMEIR